jgi:hypothetical protein
MMVTSLKAQLAERRGDMDKLDDDTTANKAMEVDKVSSRDRNDKKGRGQARGHGSYENTKPKEIDILIRAHDSTMFDQCMTQMEMRMMQQINNMSRLMVAFCPHDEEW